MHSRTRDTGMKTIISYPRCGAHWLMTLVDTCMDQKVNWQHLHDVRFWNWWEMPHLVSGVDKLEDGTVKPKFRASDLILDGFKPIIHHSSLQIARQEDLSYDLGEFVFLYREDIPSLTFSSLKHLQCSLIKENVLRIVICYKTYMAEWKKFISNYDKPVMVISYEEMLSDTKGVLTNTTKFFNFHESFAETFDTTIVDKERVYNHFPSDESRPLVRYDKKYAEEKETFINDFGDYIDSLGEDLPSIDLLRSTRSIPC